MTYRIFNRDEHLFDPGPKRILALDGGGLRGVLTLMFLKTIETVLRERHGGQEPFRLCHYFDLMAGTSTGAIIAAGLAKGLSVDEIIAHYMTIGRKAFRRDWFRHGVVRARYDKSELEAQLKAVLGESTTLGSQDLKTGLLIVTKRLDSGSPWPLANNPRGKFFSAPEEATWIANGDYPLWQIVRASTAAPMYFDPERITICAQPGHEPVIGDFVDGGVSPFNNPALQAFMYATMDGYRLNWTPGADNILMISIGTGRPAAGKTASRLAAAGAVKSLMALMDDCASLVQTMMQWMSASRTAGAIDLEVDDLAQDSIAPTPLLSYQRYDLALTADAIGPLDPSLTEEQIAQLSAMDDPGNLETLSRLGAAAALRQVEAEDFPAGFDLPPDDGADAR